MEKKLSLSDVILDTTLYYSLEDVPQYIMKSDHLIICERTLLDEESMKNEKIYPISLSSLLSDIKDIASCIMNFE